MRHWLAPRIAAAFLLVFLTAPTSPALEPLDAFPPTSFSVSLLVRPPPGEAFTKTLRIVDPNSNCAVNMTYSYNYTPAYPDCFRSRLIPPPVIWNVAAAFGVRVNGGGWDSTACMLGDISKIGSDARSVNCNDAFQGNSGPGLLFGVAGAPLLRTFQVSVGTDTVEFGASLDNVGAASVANASSGFTAALGDGIQGFGGIAQFLGATLLLSPEGPALAAVGTAIAVIGSLISTDADLNPDITVLAPETCLGGLLGNPPNGSKIPQDAVRTSMTAKQLYEGTQFGPMLIVIPTSMNYRPNDPPWAFEACQAMTNVIFVIDRPRNPGTQAWSDGLAFQPRSADNAVVRRRNAVESFRVDAVRRRIEHHSWRYAAYEDSFDPSDGLATCNGPQSCSPRAWAEPVGGYIASAADASGQRAPVTAMAGMPLTALSPDPSQLVLFFVDDMGGLYVSAAAYGTSDVPSWRTWLLATGLPANAPVAALHGYPIDFYTLFWVGTDGAVRIANLRNVPTQSQVPIAVGPISGPIARPGAAIAALERSPSIPEVFVVGENAVLLLTNPGGVWSTTPIAPSFGHVANDSALAAVATTTNNRDIFFYDAAGVVQHVAWTSTLAQWGFDSAFPRIAAASNRQLSAVSRAPDNIDVVLTCATGVLCNISIPANTFPNMLPGQSPAISTAGTGLAGPLSIVAPRSTALEVITQSAPSPADASRQVAFDTSWQLGAQSWATTAPVPTCDSNTCWSFDLSVSPTSISIAANDSISVDLSTMMLNSSNQINLTYTVPSGVAPGEFAPTSVAAGQGVPIGFYVPLGTPPGPKGQITITGNNGIETHSVSIDVVTTQCVPFSCGADTECGQLNDGCGHILNCGKCRQSLACYQGMCIRQRCITPRHCPRGYVWSPADCACIPL
jgi:hypothetical protein